MDSLINQWQEYFSLAIVAVTAVLMVRAERRRLMNKKDCSRCALVEFRNKQHRSFRT